MRQHQQARCSGTSWHVMRSRLIAKQAVEHRRIVPLFLFFSRKRSPSSSANRNGWCGKERYRLTAGARLAPGQISRRVDEGFSAVPQHLLVRQPAAKYLLSTPLPCALHVACRPNGNRPYSEDPRRASIAIAPSSSETSRHLGSQARLQTPARKATSKQHETLKSNNFWDGKRFPPNKEALKDKVSELDRFPALPSQACSS